MTMQTTIYRDHELVAEREARGWRVRITDTHRKTGLHAHPFSAFVEARSQIDALFNRGARQSIWIDVARTRRGRGLIAELRNLSGWFRSALNGPTRRA